MKGERVKRKLEEEEKGVDEGEGDAKKVKLFSAQTFRKELNEGDVYKCLKEFLKHANQEGDEGQLVLEYLEAGGSVQEILLALDESAKADLVSALPVFRILHLILLRIKDNESKYYAQAEDGIKYMLGTFVPTMQAMLNMNIERHRKVMLKLLTSIVTMFPSYAREIMNFIPASPAVLSQFLRPSSGKDSLRKWFIFFVFSFIISEDLSIIQSIMGAKGLLGDIIKDLKFDDAYTVNLVLQVLKEKVLLNIQIPKTMKLKVFNSQVVTSLFDVYNWKGPKNVVSNPLTLKKRIKDKEVDPADKEMVLESIHSFLLVLCPSKKFGVAFTDKTFGTSLDKKNNLLMTVIQSLREPWENEKVCEVLSATVVSCPDLFKVTLSTLDSALPPRESEKWNNLLNFVERLLQSMRPRDILKTATELSDVDVLRLAKELCAPASLIRHMKSGIHHHASALSILFHSMKTLTLLWRNVEEVLSAFSSHQKLRKSLVASYSSCFLRVDELLTTWQSVCECESEFVFSSVDKCRYLHAILDFLEMSSKCSDSAADSPGVVASDMLRILDSARGDSFDVDEYLNVQSRIFYMLTTLDPMSITPDNDLFGKALVLLFGNSGSPTPKYETLNSLSKVLLSTGVFENNESEVDVWLACYFHEYSKYRGIVPEFLSDCITDLYTKEMDVEQILMSDTSARDSVFTELMELDTSEVLKKSWVSTLVESPTPLLAQCVRSLSALNKKKVKSVQHYVGHVALRLFHLYDNREVFFDFCKRHEDVLGHVVERMENFRNCFFDLSDCPFSTTAERELMSWLARDETDLNVEQVFAVDGADVLTSFLAFKTVVSCLVAKVRGKRLTDADASKLSRFFRFVAGSSSGPVDSRDRSFILSRRLGDPSVFRRKCIKYLFSVPLASKFDVFEFEKDVVVRFTRLVADVVAGMPKEDVNASAALRPWKMQLLKRIKDNVRKKDAEPRLFESIEPLLSRFRYTSAEISDLLDSYCDIKDMSVFVNDGNVTLSTMILTEFVKVHCDEAEPGERVVELLQRILESALEAKADHSSVVEECLVRVLEKHPRILSLVDNDCAEGLARRDRGVSHLGRLLLSDPSKVDHFLRYVSDGIRDGKIKKAHGFLAMVSSLFRTGDVADGEDEEFFEFLRARSKYSFWRKSEVSTTDDGSDGASTLLKALHVKYAARIWCDDSDKSEHVRRHSNFFSMLSEIFTGKEEIAGLRESIAEGSFLPEVVHRAIVKHREEEGVAEAYVKGLVKIFHRSLMESGSGGYDDDVWRKYGDYVEELLAMRGRINRKSISGWKDFVRVALRTSFAAPCKPSCLRVVRLLTELLFEPGCNSPVLATTFEMLISHSQFLGVMLQSSPLKQELVALYHALVKGNGKVLSPRHVPVILASYSASLSPTDVTLLRILRLYDSSDVDVSAYEPFVWGEPAVNHYSVKADVGVSLWRSMNMLNVLELLNQKRLETSLREFPVNRDPEVDAAVACDKVYDPAFLLPLFASLLSPGAVTYCLPFVQKGCFAYTLCSLSSSCKAVRMTASVVLARFYDHLQLVQSMKLKSVWLHFINCLRYGVENVEKKPLPSVITLFLARLSLEISGEPGDMFASLRNFLLAKPIFRFSAVPEFLPLFHSSDVHYQKQSRWILEVLRDGVKRNSDLNVVFQTMALKVILSYFRSHFCARESRLLVLEVLTNVMKIPRSKLLITEYGLLAWLGSVAADCDGELFPQFVRLVSAVSDVVRASQAKGKARKRSAALHPTQILNVLAAAVPNLERCRTRETVEAFARVTLRCLLVTSGDPTWCRLNGESLDRLTKAAARMVGDETLPEKFRGNKYFLRTWQDSGDLEGVLRRILFVQRAVLLEEAEAPQVRT